MKRIFTLMALLLMAFGISGAQETYSYKEVSVEKIEVGKKYALRQSNNYYGTLKGFLSCKELKMSTPYFDENCVYEFEKVDTYSHKDPATQQPLTFDVFVLKSVANGLYMGGDGLYGDRSKAFKFTARKAKFVPSSPDEKNWDWLVYSASSSGNTFDKKTDDGLGSWVFCQPGNKVFMTFRENQKTFPYFEDSRSHAGWLVYECIVVNSSYLKLKLLFQNNFTKPVTPENYPVGEYVGCVKTQDFYNEMETAYNEAKSLLAQPEDKAKDNEYAAAYEKVKAVVDQMSKQYIALVPGHYQLICDCNESYYGNKLLAIRDAGWYTGDSRGWRIGVSRAAGVPARDFEHANFVWKLEQSGASDTYKVTNVATGRHFSTGISNGSGINVLNDEKKVQPLLFREVSGGVFHIVANNLKFAIYNKDNGSVSYYRECLHTCDDSKRKACNTWKLKPLNAQEVADVTKNPFVGKFIRIKASNKYPDANRNKYMTSYNAQNRATRTQFAAAKGENEASTIFYLRSDKRVIGYESGAFIRLTGSNGGHTFRTTPVDEKEYNTQSKQTTYAVAFDFTSAFSYNAGDYNVHYYGLNNKDCYLKMGNETYSAVVMRNVFSAVNGDPTKPYYPMNYNVEVVTTLPVTVSAAKYATFYCPVAVNIPANVKAYTGKRAGQVFQLQEISGVIPANTAVVLTAEAGEYLFELDYENKTAAVAGNELEGQMTTDYEKQEVYTLQNGDKGIGLYPFDGKKNYEDKAETHRLVAGFKGYLPETAAAGVKALNFVVDGETTGIETVEGQQKTTVYYDLSGKRVLRPAHGVFVTAEGRKVFIP